ncbi:NAD-dependent epimerase/dehydratase family protein [Delftia lacustris]|uniref:NAD-dependent epimerase/dehydratase family protein n=1 Tax=Delftia lacustris TaxID=558537 RepID=UPI0035A5C7B7
MPSIALFGAAGAIGQRLATALRQQGRAYRVVGRSEASLRQTFGADPLAEIVPWNPDSTGSVEAAAHGVDTLVYLVGVNYWQFALHPELMRRTLDGAIAAGVRRIVLIGTVYPYGKAQAHAVKEDHPRNPHTFKGRMRKAQEDLLLQAHAQGRIEAAVLRLPDFYGPGVHNSLLHGAFEAAARGGRADMVGPLDRPHEFVYVPDVGPVVARLIGTPQAFGKVWHLAGAGAITQRDVVSEIERLTGRPLKLRVAGKTALRLAGLFNPFMRELAEMHYLLTDPLIMEDSALHALLGTIAKTPYAQGIRATLNAAMASADSHLAAA